MVSPMANNISGLVWYEEVKSIYSGTETERHYFRYNANFQEWFTKEKGKNESIQEKDVREYVASFVKDGKDT